jgi:hypothetical protein
MGVFKSPTGIDLQNQKGINFADPSSSTDAANKQYVDNFVNGLAFKEEARAATTTNGTLASAYANGSSIDGITLATGDRILLKNQTTQTENGIYTVNVSGAPTRAVDADTTTDLNQATVRVLAGTTNANTQWTQSTINPTIGTNNIVFAASGGGTTYTATAPVVVTGSVISINAFGSGVIGDATSIRIDPTVVVRKFAADCVVTTNPQTFTHNLGTKDVEVQIRLNATDEIVAAVVVAATTNTITVDIGHAPTSAEYRVVVQG